MNKALSIKNIILATMVAMALVFSAVAIAAPAQAQGAKAACEGTGGTWTSDGSGGFICENPNVDQNLFGKDSILEDIVNTMLFVVGGISVVMIIVGAIRYVVSAGEQNAVQGAKNTILYAVVGLVVAVMAYAIVNFVLNSFG